MSATVRAVIKDSKFPAFAEGLPCNQKQILELNFVAIVVVKIYI
jgi:hypothetical protein